ncbi:G-protein coupled receptor 4-like [Archocentrus centrarchus]|uniref:G-protein coupled receptor 4-like n=1 Tax=Archocentrus centrarchus TaxID=63155 RepID=UPI0011E9C83F|nr:G-protein coupled receptor 4-like [Archocentrus centrarchus]
MNDPLVLTRKFWSKWRRAGPQERLKPFKHSSTMFNNTLNAASNHSTNSTNPIKLHVRPLWYELPLCAVAPYGFIFYYGVKVFNLAVGTPCNILVIWQIITKKSDASTSDTFILSLAILDAYFCLMTPIDIVNGLLLDDSGIWYFKRFAYGIKDLAPFFLVCICLDRYMAVVHPVFFTGIRDNKIRIGISVVVWALILAYALAKCILGHMPVNDVFSGIILFAFAMMIFCNISIIWVLRRSVMGKEAMHPVKKKALKMVLINLAIIVINYLPPVVLMPFASYYTTVAFHCQIRVSVFAIMDLSCSIEPLLYITKMEHVEGTCCGKSVGEKSLDVTT